MSYAVQSSKLLTELHEAKSGRDTLPDLRDHTSLAKRLDKLLLLLSVGRAQEIFVFVQPYIPLKRVQISCWSFMM